MATLENKRLKRSGAVKRSHLGLRLPQPQAAPATGGTDCLAAGHSSCPARRVPNFRGTARQRRLDRLPYRADGGAACYAMLATACVTKRLMGLPVVRRLGSLEIRRSGGFAAQVDRAQHLAIGAVELQQLDADHPHGEVVARPI